MGRCVGTYRVLAQNVRSHPGGDGAHNLAGLDLLGPRGCLIPDTGKGEEMSEEETCPESHSGKEMSEVLMRIRLVLIRLVTV
jgi:hypothetical protein